MKFSKIKKMSLILTAAIVMISAAGCGSTGEKSEGAANGTEAAGSESAADGTEAAGSESAANGTETAGSGSSTEGTEAAKSGSTGTEETAANTESGSDSKQQGPVWVVTSQDMTITSLSSSVTGTLSYTYTYDENNQLVNVNAGSRYDRNITYDENGNILTDISVTTKSDGTSSTLEYDYTYDEQGRVSTYKKVADGTTGETMTYGYGDDYYSILDDDSSSTKTLTYYDYDDKILSVWGVASDGTPSQTSEYTYDDKGNVLTYQNAYTTTECTNTYDNNGNLTRQFRKYGDYNGSEALYDEVIDYTYDEQGNVLTMEDYQLTRADQTKTVTASDEYQYDENGNVTYHKTTDEDDGTTEYWYEYDANGNQTYMKTQNASRIVEYNTTYEERE